MGAIYFVKRKQQNQTQLADAVLGNPKTFVIKKLRSFSPVGDNEAERGLEPNDQLGAPGGRAVSDQI